MYEAIRRTFEGVYRCDALGYPSGPWLGIQNRALAALGRNSYWRLSGAKFHGRQITSRLRQVKHDFDVTIVIDSLLAAGALKLPQPLVYISDCTKKQLVDTDYPGYAGMKAANLRSVMRFERQAYQNCDLLVFGSQWACDSAVRDYGVPSEKVCPIPYGANLDQFPDRETAIQGMLGETSTCKLLFLGVQWQRKGGDKAVEITRLLNERGIPTELTVCGCVPPQTDAHIDVIPFLDKHNPEDCKRLAQLLTEASYLVVPTKGDCSPIVFCEAFAHGLPVVTCKVGGVPEIVTHGVNGFVLPPTAPPHAFADLIDDSYHNAKAYNQKREAARDAFERTFNWESWSTTFQAAIIQLCSRTFERS